MYENKLEFPSGKGGVQNENLPCGECGYFLELQVDIPDSPGITCNCNTTRFKYFMCMIEKHALFILFKVVCLLGKH